MSLDDVGVELIFHNLHKLPISCFLDDSMTENKCFDPADEPVFPQFLENELYELVSFVAVTFIFAAVCGWWGDTDVDLVVVAVLQADAYVKVCPLLSGRQYKVSLDKL